jgi:Nif-specific regulatory protein
MGPNTAPNWTEPAEAHVGEVRKLSTLLETSQALLTTLDLNVGLRRVLEILGRHHGALRSSVVIVDPQTGEVAVEATAGENGVDRRNRRKEERTVFAQVLRDGKPVVIAQVGRESPLIVKAATRVESSAEERTHISVPITLEERTVGAVGVDLRYKANRDYFRTVKFLGVVGSIVAQAIKMHQLIRADRQRLVDENQHLRQELQERYDFSNLIGTSGPMRQVCEQVAQVAQASTTVLLRGESGTGKELIAHAIHYNSPRAKKPFVKVSCAALPQDLIESELFGYEKGAFTGAHALHKGRFEMANGGTLFLDEIGDLNLATQVKLLRVLQERQFERVGGTETIQVNLRLIAATSKDLEKAIAAGEFREDLYYRLNVFTIFVPPLRERKPDVLLLADHFLEKFSREHGKHIKRFSTPAIDMLASYHWPGNVRELGNVIERAVVVCDTNAVHGHHLPPTLQTAEASGTTLKLTLRAMLDGVEKDALQDALKSARGNRAQAARLLGTTARIFNYKVRKYRVDWRRFRV